MRRMLILCALAALAAGCASVTRGHDQDVAFASEPPGAAVSLTMGQACTTPCKIRLPRKDPLVALFTLNGHETVQVQVRPIPSGAIYGNIALGGMIGSSIDAHTGADNDLCPNQVTVRMRRLDARGAPIGAAGPRPEDACDRKPAGQPVAANR